VAGGAVVAKAQVALCEYRCLCVWLTRRDVCGGAGVGAGGHPLALSPARAAARAPLPLLPPASCPPPAPRHAAHACVPATRAKPRPPAEKTAAASTRVPGFSQERSSHLSCRWMDGWILNDDGGGGRCAARQSFALRPPPPEPGWPCARAFFVQLGRADRPAPPEPTARHARAKKGPIFCHCASKPRSSPPPPSV